MLSFELKKRLRDFTLDLSLEVGAETLVLIGHSGCGKSTLLRMLAGLLEPDSGNIKLNGNTLLETEGGAKPMPAEERDVGYLVQSYALFPHLSVTENVAYGLSRMSHEDQVQRVEEALELVGIRHLARAMPRELSGGEQQRVALARALARRPKFLLLDEPLSALDISTRTRVRSELRSILDRLAIPCIVVTHDYEDARLLGEQIAVMDQGEILQSGTAAEISRLPANRFVAAFTETNLLPSGDGSSHLAFDPWEVTVSSEPAGEGYEWEGVIRDIASMGAYTRLTVASFASQGNLSLLADVPQASSSESVGPGFDIGDRVFARIGSESVRFVASATTQGSIQEERVSDRAQERPHEDSDTDTHPPLPLGKRTVLSGALGASLMVVLVLGLGAYALASVLGGGQGGGGGDGEKITTLIAANMTSANGALVKKFEETHQGVEVEASYAGTQILFSQLEQGVKADLFLSADKDYIEKAKEQGLIDSFKPVSQMDEVIVVPRGNPSGIQGLEDLGTRDVELVVGVEEVPVGRYARQVFENAEQGYGSDFSERVLNNVVSTETNTRQVAQKVVLREAQAGVTYRTDITPEIADKVEIIGIPEEYNVTAKNYAGVLSDASNPELAREYLEFMTSTQGQEIISRFDYKPIS